MSKLIPFDEGGVADYADMAEQLGPRGPIWKRRSSSGYSGFLMGLGEEANRFHNRIVDLMREAFPGTAAELLAEWEEAFGLPLCGDAPDTDDERRAALAARVAAVGGASASYFVDLIWKVIEDDFSRESHPDYVWIEEWPYGESFCAWTGHAWDPASSHLAMFYWRAHIPSTTSAGKQDIIECLLERFKPAHTVLDIALDGEAAAAAVFYRCPGGSGDTLTADTDVAPTSFAPGTVLGIWLRPTSVVSEKAAIILRVAVSGVVARYLNVLLSPDSDFMLEAEVYTSLHEGSTGVLGPYAVDVWALWTFELGVDGVLAVRRDAALAGTSSASGPIPSKPGSASSFKLTGVAGSVDFANIWTLSRLFATDDERTSLAAAGRGHDPREAHDDWPGDPMAVLYRTAAVAGQVASLGSSGACNLTLNGAASSETE